MKEEIRERIEMINKGQVPEGYKKTKVGIIPKDWEESFLENLCDISTGDKDTKDRKEDGKYPFFVRSNNVESIDSYSYDGEAILTAGDGVGTGKVFHYVNGKFDYHQRVYCLREFRDINGRYLYYYFSRNFIKQVVKYSAKTSVDSVRKEMLTKMKVPTPPLPEQEKIAQILSTWDKAIELKEKLIKEKKERKKGLMQKLLTGEVRLPGFTGEWEEIRLEKLLDYEQPDKYLANEITDHDINKVPVLTANKAFILGSTAEQDGVFKDIPVIIFDDFTTNSKFVEFPFKIRSSAIKLLKPRGDNVNLRFIYELMQTIKFPRGGHKRYYISEYQYIRINLPPLEEQKAIANVLSTADKEIDLLKEELEQLKEQKKGLMQLLLTGKIRVDLEQ